jgi:hypothetical protein
MSRIKDNLFTDREEEAFAELFAADPDYEEWSDKINQEQDKQREDDKIEDPVF